MLLADESSIADYPEINEPPKLFSNPFFKKQNPPSYNYQQPIVDAKATIYVKKPKSKPSIWESEREDSMKVIPTNIGTNSNIRNQFNFSKPSVAYSNGDSEKAPVHYMSTLPVDKLLQYDICTACAMPFEVGYQFEDHKRTCYGVDQKLEAIPPHEVDRVVAHFDTLLEDIFLKLHLYAANYLSRFSVGTCAVVEDALRNVIDCISTNKISDLNTYVDKIQTSIKSISSSQTAGSPADRSAISLLGCSARLTNDKIAYLSACPPAIRQLLERIKDVDLTTNAKLEELKIWKLKCSAFSSSSFRPSVSFAHAVSQRFSSRSLCQESRRTQTPSAAFQQEQICVCQRRIR